MKHVAVTDHMNLGREVVSLELDPLPAGWRVIRTPMSVMHESPDGLGIIAMQFVEDGARWHRLGVSRMHAWPDLDDVRAALALFPGPASVPEVTPMAANERMHMLRIEFRHGDPPARPGELESVVAVVLAPLREVLADPRSGAASDILDVPPPIGWAKIRGPMGTMYQRRHDKLTTLIGSCLREDGHRWIHASVSRGAARVADADGARVARDFLGLAPGAYETWREKRVMGPGPDLLMIDARAPEGWPVLPRHTLRAV